MAQFVAGQALGIVTERTSLRKLADSLVPGRDDDADLLEHRTQLDLFRWRHEHLLSGAARRLKGGIDAGRDPFSVLVDCQDHVIDAARAWVDLVVLESFADAAERSGEPVLHQLCNLYALSTIEADRGYYQEHGRLSAGRSKAVIKAVNTLCGELRPASRMLVDAFNVPENALGDARVVAANEEQVPA
jgi:acyl-CoA oxidase